ncbi:sigma 54-interacting transcriptional regulator [Bacillota bacterium]
MNLQDNYLDILESIRGLLVIDNNENLVFMCKELIEIAGYSTLEEVVGKNIRSLLKHNNTNKAIKDGAPHLSQFYLTEGHVVASTMFPIKEGDKIIGASEYDLFQSSDEIYTFLEKLKSTEGIEHFAPIRVRNSTTKYSIDDIKGSSSSTMNTKKEIIIAARSNSNVIITGDTGTGKELVAHSVHQLSQRTLFNFVKINCAAVPGELFESELFGYEEGSFTGAKKGGKKGLAELADKGTLFLDEIDALSLQMQAKLLRFIQEKEIHRIGGQKDIPVDVRIIAATNKNLLDLIEKEEFREDLYYRLHVISIEISPLSQRKSDIPELVNNFLEELNNSMGRSVDKHRVKHLDIDALKLLMDYDWPGNVRELRNVIERAMNRCYEEVMRLEHFHDTLLAGKQETFWEDIIGTGTLEEMKNQLEKQVIKNILSKEGSTITKTAEQLGISRQMIHRKIKKYNIIQNDVK